ncbi:MAG TPA: glycosyltransferase, partial [Burkholderiaceae bacterium]|nr:glycosyltransferase [Burkholderiaceae bacterium]
HHWENTMIARRDALPRYLSVNKSEDSQAVALMVAKHPIVVIDDPNLFFYVVSGNNSWGADHFQRFFQRATFHAEGQAYERSLSVMNKHFPVLEYLQWLRSRDPRTFGMPLAPPVPDAAHFATPLLTGTARLRGHKPAQVPTSRPLTLVMAWELGGGLGHMVPLSQVARPLLAAGHTVHMVFADLSNVKAALGSLAGHERLYLWQAPTWISPLFGSSEPACYAELLFRAGYLDARRLSGLVEGWGTLLDQLRPDLLLVDHAPTALLAARGRPLRTAQFGTGFFIPVMESPIPSYREWEPVPRHRVERSESLVLQTCNTILAERGQPQLAQLQDLFRCDETFLVTVPELDHFEQRARDPGQHYFGSLASASHGKPAHWPTGPGPAVFVYLKSEYRGLGEVLKQLKAGPWRVLAYIPGLTQATVAEISGPNLRVVVDPVDMDEVCRSCDAILCQSGSGTVATALQAGKPVVMLPMHMEQLLFARRVQALGAGVHLTEDRIDQLASSLQRVLTQQSFTEAASAFARRYAWPEANRVAEAIAMRCVELAQDAVPANRARPKAEEPHAPALLASATPH